MAYGFSDNLLRDLSGNAFCIVDGTLAQLALVSMMSQLHNLAQDRVCARASGRPVVNDTFEFDGWSCVVRSRKRPRPTGHNSNLGSDPWVASTVKCKKLRHSD